MALPLVVTPVEFHQDLWHASENYSPWVVFLHCLRDIAFSRFSTVPACDGRTDTGPQHIAR